MSENEKTIEQRLAALEAAGGEGFAKSFADLMNQFRKDDATATGMTATDLHGPSGILADARLERGIINTLLMPEGIDFAVRPTNTTDPLFGALIGYTDTQGAEPDEACEPGPTPGTMSFGHMMYPLGRKAFSSDTVDLDKLMLAQDRGDTRDLFLLGDFSTNEGFASPLSQAVDQNQLLNRVVYFQQLSIARAFAKWIAATKWTGDPSGANAGYKEFWGMDNLIKTGYTDALSPNPARPQFDSYVADFGSEDLVTSTTKNIHREISEMEKHLYFKARRQGLDPVDWVIVMHPELWHELSIVWPMLAYTQYAAAGGVPSNVVVNLDARTNAEETLRMHESQRMVINGRSYPVALDDYVPMDRTAPASPESTIYMIPRSILGGSYPSTYWEHVDYRVIGAELTNPVSGNLRYWTDAGRFMWTIDQRLWCFTMHAKTEPRLVFRTPQLAGRIDNIQMNPLRVLADPTA